MEGIVWVLECNPTEITSLFDPNLPARVVCWIVDSPASVRVCAKRLSVPETRVHKIRKAVAA
jgi:hypothetical protein